MIEARIAKIVMVASLALFAFVVAFDNITDYDTNFEFVRHVLSMDAISPVSTLLYRRVTSPALWNFAYWLIIIGEGITALVLGIAAAALLAANLLRRGFALAAAVTLIASFALEGHTLNAANEPMLGALLIVPSSSPVI